MQRQWNWEGPCSSTTDVRSTQVIPTAQESSAKRGHNVDFGSTNPQCCRLDIQRCRVLNGRGDPNNWLRPVRVLLWIISPGLHQVDSIASNGDPGINTRDQRGPRANSRRDR